MARNRRNFSQISCKRPASAHKAMPWINGGGVTHEIAKRENPAGATSEEAAPFVWRLSMADLTGSGPFSRIPEVDRILVLLYGENVKLTVGDDAPVTLGKLGQIEFPADVPTDLEMTGNSGRDINLMWARGDAQGQAEVLHRGEKKLFETKFDDGDPTLRTRTVFVMALGGPARVAVDGIEHTLEAEFDCVEIESRGLGDLCSFDANGKPAHDVTVIEGTVYAAAVEHR